METKEFKYQKAKESVEDGKKNGKKASVLDKELAPIRTAARRVARMLCQASLVREYFISDGTATKHKLDTKALKEFSSVLKEMSAVVNELYAGAEHSADNSGVKIEFSDEALDMSL